MSKFILGKLSAAALPHEWFTIGGTVAITLMMLAVAVFITYKRRWRWLWREWLTSTDPKKIGIMYIIVATLMFFRGALDAIMLWLQQAISVGNSYGYLTADHFQQIFTAHGVIMVFFVTMGFLFGLLNLIVPLQIGARDLAYPFMNSLSFWLYAAGAVLVNLFFVVGGEFAATGWLAVAPLSGPEFSPGVGVDYWIWSLQVSGLGTLLGGLNFLVTIFKKRAPGMTLMRMPLFTWTSLCASALVVSVFPVLAMTTFLLFLDRTLGMHFFTSGGGGNPMMYINLIWMWGHPEVYILILPAFGIYSEIVSTFSGKRLAGYGSLVAAAIAISALSLVVWLHHFFTMGAGADVNAFFGIMTMIIAIPTAAQIFNWIFTMRKGRIRFTTPMKWFFGFAATFTFGGLAGVFMASPPADFQVHNSLFLVAHFHTMVVGGALFGIFAGITYWFPKIFGWKLDEKWGSRAFWLWILGFFVSFVPLYILGFMGATRRLDHYTNPAWQPLFATAAFGSCIIALAVFFQLIQLYVSWRDRHKNRDTTGDPWDGRTLEWATSSPPPSYNFAVIPEVSGRDAFWHTKKEGHNKIHHTVYKDILMPKNTAQGIYISAFALIFGFAMVWSIYWLAAIGLIGAITCLVIRALDEDTEYVLKASELARLEAQRHQHARA